MAECLRTRTQRAAEEAQRCLRSARTRRCGSAVTMTTALGASWVFLLNFAGPAEGRRCGCAARGSFCGCSCSTSPDQQRGGDVGAQRGGVSVGVPAQLRRTSRGAALWVRGAGELLPASALVAELHSSPRGSAATGRLRRCCEGIPGCAQANGMGSFSGQHLDLDVTRGAPRFHDAVRALVGAAQEAAGVRGQDLPPPGQASGAARTRRGRSALARAASCGQ
jgi:hypothetical protein